MGQFSISQRLGPRTAGISFILCIYTHIFAARTTLSRERTRARERERARTRQTFRRAAFRVVARFSEAEASRERRDRRRRYVRKLFI